MTSNASALHALVAGIERVHLGREVALLALGGSRTSSSQSRPGLVLARTISSVPSVEPSLTMIQRFGSTVCATTDWSVFSMKAASLRAGVIENVVEGHGGASIGIG